MVDLICPICGVTFKRKPNYVRRIKNKDSKLTCSINCSRLYHIGDKGSHWKGSTISINCKYCNKSFVGDIGRKYCSPECGHLDRIGKEGKKQGERLKIICIWCNKEFERLKCNIKAKHKFCSSDCLHKWMEGRYSGENNGRWRKDRNTISDINVLRNLREMTDWKLAVYKRDEFTCQLCGGTKSGSFNAHHIKMLAKYKDLAFNVSNGITLCVDCHKKVTWKEEQFENLFDCMVNGMEC
ncbi:MAG: HNH endonuclease [Actinobacteria bacterium]|nr:HNH endonuclease [Actinomycetota bacterium]MBE3114888.1 HNH endonuclease [Actinomycetota bacterium]